MALNTITLTPSICLSERQQGIECCPYVHIRGGSRISSYVRGGALKKNWAERREAQKLLGYFVWKITILRQKIIFFPILRRCALCAPPAPDVSPLIVCKLAFIKNIFPRRTFATIGRVTKCYLLYHRFPMESPPIYRR